MDIAKLAEYGSRAPSAPSSLKQARESNEGKPQFSERMSRNVSDNLKPRVISATSNALFGDDLSGYIPGINRYANGNQKNAEMGGSISSVYGTSSITGGLGVIAGMGSNTFRPVTSSGNLNEDILKSLNNIGSVIGSIQAGSSKQVSILSSLQNSMVMLSEASKHTNAILSQIATSLNRERYNRDFGESHTLVGENDNKATVTQAKDDNKSSLLGGIWDLVKEYGPSAGLAGAGLAGLGLAKGIGTGLKEGVKGAAGGLKGVAGGATKFLGRRAIPGIGAALSAYDSYAETGDLGRAFVSGGGSLIGGLAGGALGSALGPVGTVAGGTAGTIGGSKLATSAYDWLFGKQSEGKAEIAQKLTSSSEKTIEAKQFIFKADTIKFEGKVEIPGLQMGKGIPGKFDIPREEIMYSNGMGKVGSQTFTGRSSNYPIQGTGGSPESSLFPSNTQKIPNVSSTPSDPSGRSSSGEIGGSSSNESAQSDSDGIGPIERETMRQFPPVGGEYRAFAGQSAVGRGSTQTAIPGSSASQSAVGRGTQGAVGNGFHSFAEQSAVGRGSSAIGGILSQSSQVGRETVQYRKPYKLSEADLSDAVVNKIAGEANLSDPRGVDAVIQTGINRLGTKGYGPSSNLKDVFTAEGQFVGNRKPTPAQAKMIRERIKANASGSVPDITGGATEFRSSTYGGRWARNHPNAVNIGGNKFARNPNAVGPYAPYPKGRPGEMGPSVDIPLREIDRGQGRTTPGLVGPGKEAVRTTSGNNFSVVGNAKSRGVNQDLAAMAREASSYLPEGYRAEVYSGNRPGDSRFHGKGIAMDVRLIGPDGKMISNYQNPENFRTYEKFAQNMKKIQSEQFPQYDKAFRWGGYFGGPPGKYGSMDLMHLDLGGRQVGMGGGSFEKGLNETQRKYYGGRATSEGMGDISKYKLPERAGIRLSEANKVAPADVSKRTITDYAGMYSQKTEALTKGNEERAVAKEKPKGWGDLYMQKEAKRESSSPPQRSPVHDHQPNKSLMNFTPKFADYYK